jgi:pimeloyl-ACP methyl ester carboxylesterase
LHADIVGSTLVLLPDTGHYVQFEKTREVADAIQRIAEGTEANGPAAKDGADENPQ